MMKHFLLPLVFLTNSVAAHAQQDDSLLIRRLADTVLTHGGAYENLRVLTKQIGARLAGSPATYKAEKWGAEALRKAGADTVYFQDVIVPHWVRGGKDEVRILSNRRDYVAPLATLALGNSNGSGEKGVTAPVIEVKDFDDLEAKKDQLKGKIVFYNYPFNPRFVETFKAYSDAVRYRGSGPSRAAKYGAVGVVIRSMSHGTNNFPHTGALHYNDSFPKIPALALGLEDADRLSARIKNDPSLKLFLRTWGKMLPDTLAHNVIGEIRGSEFPDQYITVGGHLDSWDVNEGANDDGTGIVQSIQVLEAFKKLGLHPKHTIRIVLYANEENATNGGREYAKQAKLKGEKHVFALESDAGGFTPRGFSLEVTPAQRAKVASWIPLLQPYGVYTVAAEGAGEDVGYLRPAIGTPVGELEPDSQRYFDLHHAPNDVLENVNKREMELGAIEMSALIYLVDKYGL
ncbi:Peptidase family M28 [Chitinophaga costaii]|uniref:Carboxypeptidase Q n=2 Tax=Chitinophaga costaii TaxID=1335309 RepID=A0A1C4G4A5_9BACT|nr:Peptidase family M28 [Chitinophaga costaii]